MAEVLELPAVTMDFAFGVKETPSARLRKSGSRSVGQFVPFQFLGGADQHCFFPVPISKLENLPVCFPGDQKPLGGREGLDTVETREIL